MERCLPDSYKNVPTALDELDLIMLEVLGYIEDCHVLQQDTNRPHQSNGAYLFHDKGFTVLFAMLKILHSKSNTDS